MTEEARPLVSVVVPVYNPGPRIEPLIRSLLRQSLRRELVEVVFVDDGSTDGTPQRVQSLCAREPGFRVLSIPGSGWPGRPRNVGIDAAAGTYVFFCDHDDELFPEALERLCAMAERNRSDIVYGKVVRQGRSTPYWTLAHRTIGVADLVRDPLLVSRTIHKLFRRSFLVEQGLRFPEGPVRLEDYAFMGQALPRARVVSVLADYPCYRWIHWSDGSNNSSRRPEPELYLRCFAASLQEMVAAGGELAGAVQRAAARRLFLAFRPRSYDRASARRRNAAFSSVRAFLLEHVPETVDAELPAPKRARLRALRAGDRETFDRLQAFWAATSVTARLIDARWRDGVLELQVEATVLGPDGRPLELDVARAVPCIPDLGLGAQVEDRELLPSDLGSLEVSVRHHDTAVEWPVAGTTRVEQVPVRDGYAADQSRTVTLRARCTATIDPCAGWFGQALDDGTWDVLAHAAFVGEGGARRVLVDSGAGLPAGASRDGRRAMLVRSRTGWLTLQLRGGWAPQRIGVRRTWWEGSRLHLSLEAPTCAGHYWLEIARGPRGFRALRGPRRLSAPVGVARTHDGSAVLDLADLPPGAVAHVAAFGGTPGGAVRAHVLVPARGALTRRPSVRLRRTPAGGLEVARLGGSPARTVRALVGPRPAHWAALARRRAAGLRVRAGRIPWA
jgi:hypothetical protein